VGFWVYEAYILAQVCLCKRVQQTSADLYSTSLALTQLSTCLNAAVRLHSEVDGLQRVSVGCMQCVYCVYVCLCVSVSVSVGTCQLIGVNTMMRVGGQYYCGFSPGSTIDSV